MFKIPNPPVLLAGLAATIMAGGFVRAALNRDYREARPAGQTLGIASVSRIRSLDPHEEAEAGTSLMRTRLVQATREGLVEFDPRRQVPVPAVAESWEISRDNLSAVFHLRPGLRWNNGEPQVAGDFVFAYRLALTSGAPVSESLAILKNARAIASGRITDARRLGVTALDAQTLRLYLEHPVPGLLLELCDRAWLPLHPGSITALHDRTYWRDPGALVTNGAFELAGATVDAVTLRPNPHYRDRGSVRLTRLVVRYTEDPALYPRLLQSGQVQLSDRLASGEIALPLPDGIQLWRDPTLAVGYVHFNLRAGPLADGRVRHALSLALDRAALAGEISSANVRPAYSCLPPIGDQEEPPTVVEDLAEARRLLAAAGHAGGQGLAVLRWPYRTSAVDASVRLPEACSAQWRRRLGVEVYVIPLDNEEFDRRVDAHEFDVVLAPLLGTVPDRAHLASLLTGTRMCSFSGWDGGEVARLAELAREESGDALRSRVVSVERAFLAAMPATPLIFYNRHMLKSLSVAGWYPDATGLHPLKNLYLSDGTEPRHAD